MAVVTRTRTKIETVCVQSSAESSEDDDESSTSDEEEEEEEDSDEEAEEEAEEEEEEEEAEETEGEETEEEEENINRDDPNYSPPAIPSHPAELYPTVLTPGTSGSKIWTKIRDLMKVIPAPGPIKWDDNDSRNNTSQKTGDREKTLNEDAKKRLAQAPSIKGDQWQEAMETYLDCLPSRPQDSLIEDRNLNTTTPQLGVSYYNLGNLCRPSHLTDEGGMYRRHMNHDKWDFRYNMLVKLLHRSPGTLK